MASLLKFIFGLLLVLSLVIAFYVNYTNEPLFGLGVGSLIIAALAFSLAVVFSGWERASKPAS